MSYAVYSRQNPELKVLALLIPSTHKITYTPNGVQEFKFRQLPSYHDFLLKYLPQRSKYVFIEYEKGRSVEDSVRLFPDVNMPKIVDIDTTGVKADVSKLGERDQVEKLEAFLGVETNGRQKSVYLSLKLMIEDVMEIFEPGKLDTEYYLISDAVSSEMPGHMESIIISRDEVEIFDPNGKTTNYDFSGWV